ncbi:hypothetical protein [Fulvimarina sp. MAC3]|uniref:hypothetical protein n=1 Tax=Fulvimarina sp. MAC3 TaxID=3148887 RepID=UPI0031FC9AC4
MFRPMEMLSQFVRMRRIERQRQAVQLIMDEMPDWQRRDIGLPATLAEETARLRLDRTRTCGVR